jgi:hypothetical protein
MTQSKEKLTEKEWIIFFIIASMIGASFVISQVKVYVIKTVLIERIS